MSFLDQLMNGSFNTNDVLTLVIGGLTGISFFFFWMTLVEGDQTKKRAKFSIGGVRNPKSAKREPQSPHCRIPYEVCQ